MQRRNVNAIIDYGVPLAFSTRVALYYQHSIALLSQCSFDFDAARTKQNAFPVHSCIWDCLNLKHTHCNCFVYQIDTYSDNYCSVHDAYYVCLCSVYRALENQFTFSNKTNEIVTQICTWLYCFRKIAQTKETHALQRKRVIDAFEQEILKWLLPMKSLQITNMSALNSIVPSVVGLFIFPLMHRSFNEQVSSERSEITF